MNQNSIKTRLIHVLFKRKYLANLIYFLIGFCTCGFLFIVSSSLNEDKLALNQKTISNTNVKNKHKLAIVVPFRDRFDELLVFVPHMSKFMAMQSIDFKIYIINQIDEYRFNRASLINVGFLASMTECDYMAMHDVDLLPLNPKLNYSYPLNGLHHLSAPGLHPEYDYKTFIGGILIVNNNDFISTNGNI